MQHVESNELLDEPGAQPLYVHGFSGHEMLQRLDSLRLAKEPSRTTSDRFAVFAHHRGLAYRTFFGQRNRLETVRPLAQHDGSHFGYHIASAPDDDSVADTDVLAMQLINVVQRCITHGNPANEYRFQTSDRRQSAGSPDLEFNGFDQGEFFLRRKLVRDGPARRTRHETQLALQCETVDLVHDAVDVVAE